MPLKLASPSPASSLSCPCALSTGVKVAASVRWQVGCAALGSWDRANQSGGLEQFLLSRFWGPGVRNPGVCRAGPLGAPGEGPCSASLSS